jgi:hypothetical protein
MPGVGQANPVPTKQPVRSGRVGDNESDWSAPLLPDKSSILEQRCSLYRTTLWQQLTPEQRTELGKHEVASVASTGIWLEIMLMRLLARLAYQGDAVSRRVQYALTELGEECRHTIMFARMIEKLGTPVYGPPPHIRALGNLLPAMATGPSAWAAILIGEELPDRFQRELAENDAIQPLVRMVSRIHILEEARHISFARAELPRAVATTSRAGLIYHRLLTARFAFVMSRCLVSPLVYRSVGLDPRAARAAALANPYHQQTIQFSGEKLVAYLSDNRLIGGPGLAWWRRSFLLG